MRSDFSLKTNREPTRSEKTKRKYTEGSERESSLQRTSSPGTDSEGKTKRQKANKNKISKGQPHIIRVGHEKYPPQHATKERRPYKQCKTTQIGRQVSCLIISHVRALCPNNSRNGVALPGNVVSGVVR